MQIANELPQKLPLKDQVDNIENKIGTTDISTIGDGTITGAIASQNESLTSLDEDVTELNTGLATVNESVEQLNSDLTVTGGKMSEDNTIFWSRYGHIVIISILNCIPNTVKQVSPAPIPIGSYYSAIHSTDLSQSIWNMGIDGYAYIVVGDGSKQYTGQIVYICK